MLATTFVWRKKFAAEVVVTRKGSLSTHSYRTIPQQLAEVARILLKHGANVKAQDNDGFTPLDLASQDERLAEVAHVFIQHGAGPGAH
jgi:ankyrin repeat protein